MELILEWYEKERPTTIEEWHRSKEQHDQECKSFNKTMKLLRKTKDNLYETQKISCFSALSACCVGNLCACWNDLGRCFNFWWCDSNIRRLNTNVMSFRKALDHKSMLLDNLFIELKVNNMEDISSSSDIFQTDVLSPPKI